MDLLKKLNAYEFFSYIPHGFLLVLFTDWIFETGFRTLTDLSLANVALLLVATYSIGHLIASGANFFLEEIAANKLLGLPSNFLLGKVNNIPRWKKLLFKKYTSAMESSLIKLHNNNMDKIGAEAGKVDNSFWISHMYAIRDEAVAERLLLFSTSKNYCRNMAFVLMLIFLLGTIAATTDRGIFEGKLFTYYFIFTSVTLTIFILYFLRFLKFHRQYTLDVLGSSAFQTIGRN